MVDCRAYTSKKKLVIQVFRRSIPASTRYCTLCAWAIVSTVYCHLILSRNGKTEVVEPLAVISIVHSYPDIPLPERRHAGGREMERENAPETPVLGYNVNCPVPDNISPDEQPYVKR